MKYSGRLAPISPEEPPVKSLVVLALILTSTASAAQTRPALVVNTFTTAAGVEVPYDLKQLHPQIVAELKVMLAKEFEVVAAPPETASTAFTVNTEISAWRPGNAAKRFLVGMGAGREASDLTIRVTDATGRNVLEKKETVRTSFFNQSGASSGTLANPIAKKIAERLKDSKLSQ
jgi:hypothetical protein